MPIRDLKHVGVFLSQVPSEGLRHLIFEEKVCPSKIRGISGARENVQITFRVGQSRQQRTFVVTWDLESGDVKFFEVKSGRRRYQFKRQPLSEEGWLIEVRSSLLNAATTTSSTDQRSLQAIERELSEHYEHYEPLGVEPPHDPQSI